MRSKYAIRPVDFVESKDEVRSFASLDFSKYLELLLISSIYFPYLSRLHSSQVGGQEQRVLQVRREGRVRGEGEGLLNIRVERALEVVEGAGHS